MMKKGITPKNGQKKRVCVSLTEQDYARLSRLAQEDSRSLPGYLRWLLHQHFRNPEGNRKLDGK